MNTKHFDYIIEAAETLNFNQAAERLFISQPALSYQIKAIEEEIGFAIFERRGKAIYLTPAGQQFVQELRLLRERLQALIEEGQNFSSQYTDNIRLGFSQRSMLYFLPEAMQDFRELQSQVLITPQITYQYNNEDFINDKIDLYLSSRDMVEKLPNAIVYPLYKSRIYLLVRTDDPLAQKELVSAADLTGRTLLVNGGSSQQLRRVQQETLRQNTNIKTMNSPTHDFTMIQVAANKAVCLSPGYLNDFSGEFAWVPFDTDQVFDMVLVRHKYDTRPIVEDFILLLQDIYKERAESYKY